MKRLIAISIAVAVLTGGVFAASNIAPTGVAPATGSTVVQRLSVDVGSVAGRSVAGDGASVDSGRIGDPTDSVDRSQFHRVKVPPGVDPAAVSGAHDIRCPGTDPCAP